METKDQQLIDMTSDRDHYQTELGKAMQQLAAKDVDLAGVANENKWLADREKLMQTKIVNLEAKLAAKDAEIERLKAGEDWIRGKLVEITAAAIAGLADTAIVKQGTYDADTALSAVGMLAERSRSLQAQLAASERKVGEAMDLLERIRQAPLDMYDRGIVSEITDFLAARKEGKP